jgi:Rieske Fe-S protein
VHFVGDRFKHRGARPIEDLAPGEGDIVSTAGEKVAGYRDEDGRLFAVSPVCTHMGCQVNFNRAERSWDCPCHGSRFSPDGKVINGPAVSALGPKPIPTRATSR